MPDRKQELKDRIKELEAKKKIELTSEDASEMYVIDLNNSIQNCKRELEFLKDNPKTNYVMVNGG